MNERDAARDTFEAHRGLLFALAYRMVGMVADAEDLVQETYLRWEGADRSAVRSPKDYLSATVTRLAIDHLRSARVRREQYVGPWIPEPLVGAAEDDPLDAVTLAESLSTAFLMVLERLSPVERAVLLLRDAFGFEYADVARIVERSEANCRQIAKRARDRATSGRPRFAATPSDAEDVARSFTAACRSGDIESLLRLVAPDAILWTDGGGKAPAARNPILGADRITRFFVGILRKWPHFTVRIAPINGSPGLIVEGEDGFVRTVTFGVRDGRIEEIFMVANPDKLQRLPCRG